MPTKKVKSTLALHGCRITFAANTVSANNLRGQSLATVKGLINDHGGEYVSQVEVCTHLVADQAQYSKGLKKIEQAKLFDIIRIVSFDWLHEALNSDTAVAEDSYILTSSLVRDATVVGHVMSNGAVDTINQKLGSAENIQSKKRSHANRSGASPEPEAKKLKADTAATNIVRNVAKPIPLDEGLCSPYQVFVRDDSTVFDATLNQSNAGANNNKFYRIQLVRLGSQQQWFTWTRWGRVGEYGQTAMLGSGSHEDALLQFNKKFKDKTGYKWDDRNAPPKKGKYAFIERSYDESDDEDEPDSKVPRRVKQEEEDANEQAEVESKLAPPIQELMKLIFNKDYFNNTFNEFDYDAEKMPLGKLSKSTLLRGYEVLKQLATLVGSSGDSGQISDLSNQYLSIVPHVVPRGRRPPIISSMNLVKKEIELIEALTDMQLANDIMKTAKKTKAVAEESNILDRQYQGLNLEEMTPLHVDSKEFRELQAYLMQTVGHTHGVRYQVQEIFRIQRQGEKQRFDDSEYASLPNKNRRLLWHGSRVTNFSGIISQGLRIAPPEVCWTV